MAIATYLKQRHKMMDTTMIIITMDKAMATAITAVLSPPVKTYNEVANLAS